MGKFSKIKKYNLDSLSIDEKIKFLDKEMEKTGLNEQPANSTSGVYSGSKNNPNKQYAEFTAKSFNGQPFAMSGDSELGHKNVGGATIRADGAALSPPHPVTGVRRTTSTKGGLAQGGIKLARPGERPTPDSRMTGPILWYYDPNASMGQGSWRSLEYNSPEVHGNGVYPSNQGGFGYWGSGAFGFLLLRSDGAAFSPLFAALNDSDGNQFSPDTMSNPETVVLTQDRVDDPDFLPIDIAKRFIAELLGLAGVGLDFLTGASAVGTAASNIFDIGIDAFTDLVAKALGVGSAKDTYDDYVDDFIPDLAKGKNPPGSSKNNPKDPYKDGMTDETKNDWEDIFNEYQNELESGVPPSIAKVPKNYQNIANANGDIGNITGTPNTSADVDDGFEDNGDGTTTFYKAYDFDGIKDMMIQAGNPLVNIGTFSYGVYKGAGTSIVTSPEFDIKKPLSSGKSPTMYIGITFDNKTGKYIPNYKPKSVKESLDESVKLGHFNPEALTVDIEDIRKGIMPEFPEKPPAEMIDGYSAKSKLAPKVIKGEPTIKVTKKDLAALHILKDSEIKELLQQIDLINAHLQKNPADLIYAQQRYPKTDIRLAKLNWKMDQMMNASKEYLDTQFPENQRLVDRIKKATKKTMELTNPEAYKNLNKPDMELMSLDDHMKQKRIVSRHFKKKRQSKSMFRVDMNKVKEKNRKVAEQKVAEWQEKRRIELLNSNEFEDQKYDWRKEIGEDFVNTTQGMKVGQTFTHVPSGQTVTTGGVLGGIETIQTSVELFGDAVPGPTESQYGLQGFAKPIDIMRRGSTKKAEQLNKELDSSEEYTKKVKADKFMKARVEEKYSEQNEMKIVDSLFNSIDQYGNVKDQKVLKKASDYNLELKNNQAELNKRVKEIEEYRVKQTEWEKESERNAKIINSRIQSNISKVKSFVSRYGEKLSDTFPMGSSDIRVAQGGTKLVVISHSGFNYDDSKKFNVRVFDQYVNPETGKKEKIAKIKGNFGITSEADSLFRNPFGKVSGRKGQATIQYVGVGAEIENRMFEIQDIESKPMPKIPPYLMKNQALGWYNAPQSITDSTKNKIITGDFARNVLGAIGSLISSIPGADRQGYEGDIEYAAKLSKDMMDGNLTVDRGPQSKSFNKRLLGLISKNPDRNSVTRSDYAGGVDAIKELPVRLAIQSFEWNATEEGILVNDKFDFDINISGGAISAIPGVQRAIKMVSDAMRMRSVELGFNQVESKYNKTSKKFIYNNMASPEFKSTPSDTMLPVGTQGGQGGKSLGSTTQRGGKEDPYIKAALASNTSVDGFDKDIKILIPWSQVAKDAPALMSKKPTGSSATKTTTPIQSKKTSKVVKGIKKISKSKSIGFDRDDVSFRRKKKRVDR